MKNEKTQESFEPEGDEASQAYQRLADHHLPLEDFERDALEKIRSGEFPTYEWIDGKRMLVPKEDV